MIPITTFKTPDSAMAPASLGVCPETLKVQNQGTDVSCKSRDSKEGNPCNHSLSPTQVAAKGPPWRLMMALMSGANSRELSSPKSSCRQGSKAIALLEMAGVTQGVVKVQLHDWFIFLSPAGFSDP